MNVKHKGASSSISLRPPIVVVGATMVASVVVVSSPSNRDELVVIVVFCGATVLPEEEGVASAEKTLAAAKPMQHKDMIMTGSMPLPHV